ncbi:MAG: NAD-dependent epimerase/dehydratase family protein [Deltaproteobacteria bacterium]|nr:NAD-dependent epimerase/dehydratase family protein [Deltaproteobacteria bacterium]
MGKRVAITGVTSYFALTLLPYLQADPDVDEIIGIGRKPWTGGYDKLTYHREDIRSDKLFEIFKGVDTVYHLAFVVGEIHDKKSTLDININGSRNVFKACAENKVKKVIYTSSMTAYGSHRDNILGLTEESPLRRNEDNYYNSSKIDVENFVTEFFSHYPDITLTVLRAGLLVGPNINNMFSDLWSMKLTALPAGRTTHNQMISEEDLGEAMYNAFKKELPGIFNVAADDAVPTKWCFNAAGAVVIPLPTFLLKIIAKIAFKLHLFPASEGWVSVGEYTIFCNNEKFKKAANWKPRYSSKQAFEQFLKSRERDARDNPIQAVLSWIFKSGARTRPTMAVLNIFKLGKIPGLRRLIPWMNPKKNSISYLPVNKNIEGVTNEVLPSQIVHDFIDKASVHVIMDKCGCRLARKCEHHTPEIGCLFMGDTALMMPHGVSRKVTKKQAHAHVEKAVGVGLIPMTGKVRIDNFIFLTPDKSRLLSVCFCCHCCCMMTSLRHIPGDYLNGIMQPIEGLSIEVTEKCIGCGTCIETCGFDAIKIENGHAVHSIQCRGCGRCATNCPQQAVNITIKNPNYLEDIKKRINSYITY